MAATTTCLQTTVVNLTGSTKTFGFLPPHGVRLGAGENYIFFGDFAALFSAIGSQRSRDSLYAALEAGHIAIAETPSPHYFDGVLTEPRVLKVVNGSVTVNDPCWGAYHGSASDAMS